MRAGEIHAAAQQLAAMPVSWNSVKDGLPRNAYRPDSPIGRISHGRYRHH